MQSDPAAMLNMDFDPTSRRGRTHGSSKPWMTITRELIVQVRTYVGLMAADISVLTLRVSAVEPDEL